ncbi:MAG TPA: type II toxin-antitoxin system VapC family toxin [Isosphaeraceae bacterium]|jgi:tRNA(fMet)-specific endonuclease VapC
MSFLLDTDTCSQHLKRPSGLIHRFIQHAGRLFIPTIVLGELYACAYQRSDPSPLLRSIQDDLLRDVAVIPFDEPSAREFGRIRGALLRRGIAKGRMDLLIASVALAHDLTVVTHNTNDYVHVPGLRLADWLAP